jgi:hypothetical protein
MGIEAGERKGAWGVKTGSILIATCDIISGCAALIPTRRLSATLKKFEKAPKHQSANRDDPPNVAHIAPRI